MTVTREIKYLDISDTLDVIKRLVMKASEQELNDAESLGYVVFKQHFEGVRNVGEFFLFISQLLVAATQMIEREREKPICH